MSEFEPATRIRLGVKGHFTFHFKGLYQQLEQVGVSVSAAGVGPWVIGPVVS